MASWEIDKRDCDVLLYALVFTRQHVDPSEPMRAKLSQYINKIRHKRRVITGERLEKTSVMFKSVEKRKRGGY